MEPTYLVAQLNAKLQPLDRGEAFEDPLQEVLEEAGIGSVSGGGTLQSESGEIEYCDIEIEMNRFEPDTVQLVIDTLEKLGAPKGSILHVEAEERQVPFGASEGLAVYLNGTDLPDDTYAKSDVNLVYSEFARLLDGVGGVFSYWEGPTETALYMYGRSFDEMKNRLDPFLASYPLCSQCRVVQVA